MSLILSGTDGLSDVDGSAATPAIRGTDANTGMFFPAADTIAFSEGGVESMRLDSSGNLGIGTASPVERLTVTGAISTNTDLVLKEGTTSRGFIFGTSAGLFYRATSGLPHVFQNVGTELMRITSAGNVGIGNAAPAQKFVITEASVNFVTSVGGGTQYIGTTTNNDLALITNSIERMRLNTTGALVLQGALTTANGTGITFPATQSASSNANTLDDYEVGTYTATLTPQSGTITLSSNTLSYTKIGRQVTVTGYLSTSSVSSPIGSMNITLPFVTTASVTTQSTGVLSGNALGSGSCNNFWIYTPGGVSYASIFMGGSTSVSASSANTVIAGTEFRISFTYFTA
jgi:hypothetical protein